MTDLAIAHIGYVVSEMDAAVRRWVEGGAVVVIEPTDDPIQRVTCCLLDSHGTPIELVAPLGDDSPIGSRLKRGGGLDHICYYTDSLERELEREKAAGGLVVLGAVLAGLVSPLFIVLSGFVGAGLMFAGISGACAMATVLARMPWNRVIADQRGIEAPAVQ